VAQSGDAARGDRTGPLTWVAWIGSTRLRLSIKWCFVLSHFPIPRRTARHCGPEGWVFSSATAQIEPEYRVKLRPSAPTPSIATCPWGAAPGCRAPVKEKTSLHTSGNPALRNPSRKRSRCRAVPMGRLSRSSEAARAALTFGGFSGALHSLRLSETGRSAALLGRRSPPFAYSLPPR
jgi:hypothetical protein